MVHIHLNATAKNAIQMNFNYSKWTFTIEYSYTFHVLSRGITLNRKPINQKALCSLRSIF